MIIGFLFAQKEGIGMIIGNPIVLMALKIIIAALIGYYLGYLQGYKDSRKHKCIGCLNHITDELFKPKEKAL